MHCFRVLLILVVAGLALSSTTAAQQIAGKNVYNKTLRSTVLVITSQGERASQGTGWILDKSKRWVVTNHHVVGTSERVTVIFPFFRNGRAVAEREFYVRNAPRISGRVVDSDVKRDLALIELDSLPADAVEVKQARESPSPGDNVHAVGNPSASDALWVYTSGTVRQVYRKKITQEGETFDARIIETQSPLNPGDSGGPVLNDQGELVGVSRAIRVGVQLVAICVDVSEVRDFIKEADKNPRRTAATTPTTPTRAPTVTSDRKSRAVDLLKRGQYDPAIQAFTEAIKADPSDAALFSGRGDAHWRKGEYAQAIVDFDEAIKLNPKDPVTFNNRGRALLGKGEHDRALADFNEALRLNPDFPAALRNRAFILAVRNEQDKAVTDCNSALFLTENSNLPRDPLAYATRSYARVKQKDVASAMADLAEARKILAILPATYLDDVKEVVRLHPEDGAAQALLAFVAMTRQNHDLVATHAGEALKIDARNVVALLSRAESSLVKKDLEKAVADCTEVVQIDPKIAEAYQLRARAYAEKGEKEKAEKDLEEFNKLKAKAD